MRPRFPAPLQPGARIAITAPSSGVAPGHHARLDRAIDALRARGYVPVEGATLRRQHKDASAPAAERAAELMGGLLDPDIRAVMPPWGGELAIELLPLLDFEALAALPPKWLSGFSDLSTLQLPLLLRAGWAGLHGPNLMELGAAELDPTTAALWRVLEAAPGGVIDQQASTRCQPQPVADWVSEPAANLRLSEPTRWQRLDGSGALLQLQGRLVGGCIETVSRLAGTPYGDVPGFVRAQRDSGVLLFLENCESAPPEFMRALASLRLHGWFEGLAGVLIGRSTGPDATDPDRLSHLDALRAQLGDLPCPVLYDLDIGHRPPQLSLVQGARAELRWQDGGGTLRQTLA